MKKFILYIVAVLSIVGCLDDKTNYDYRDINDFSLSTSQMFTNWQSSYVLYPGEEVTIEPTVLLFDGYTCAECELPMVVERETCR